MPGTKTKRPPEGGLWGRVCQLSGSGLLCHRWRRFHFFNGGVLLEEINYLGKEDLLMDLVEPVVLLQFLHERLGFGLLLLRHIQDAVGEFLLGDLDVLLFGYAAEEE